MLKKLVVGTNFLYYFLILNEEFHLHHASEENTPFSVLKVNSFPCNAIVSFNCFLM